MRKVGECGLKAALANIAPGVGYIRPDLHVHGFLAFLSSKPIRWQGALSGSSGCAPRGRDRSRTTDDESDNIDE